MYKTIRSKWHLNVLRITISIVAFTWVAFQTYSQFRQNNLSDYLDLSRAASGFMIIAFLTPLNLYFETQKWTSLLPTKIGLKQAMQSILAGMCSGFFTPNRLGEFSGRYAVLPLEYRKGAISATFIGSFVQATFTVSFGLIAIIFLGFPDHSFSLLFDDLILVAIIILILMCLLGIPKVRMKARSFYRNMLKSLNEVSLHQLIMASIWAFSRYLLFSTQLVIALYVFGFEGQLIQCFGLVALLFFCQTYMPLSIGSELGVREVLAVFLLGPFMSVAIHAAMATLVVWLANVLLPVVLGGVILQNTMKNQIIQTME